MGFKRTPRQYNFKFADGEYEGLEVSLKALKFGEMLKLDKLRASQDPDDGLEMFEMVADALVSWNLEDEDGNPIPAGPDGFDAIDMDFGLFLMEQWFRAMVDVPGPLDRLPSVGETSVPPMPQMELS